MPLPKKRNRAERLTALAERLDAQSRRGDFQPGKALFTKQLACYEDKARQRAVLCTRRAGKTHLAAFELIESALEFPGSTNAYVTFTRVDARERIWDGEVSIRKLCALYGIDADFNDVDLVATFPNGSRIVLKGCEDEGSIERFRGPGYQLVFVDEVQSFPAYFSKLLATILPALMKAGSKGRIVLMGTPSVLPVGYWYELWNGAAGEGWSKHEWTLYDNDRLGSKAEIDEFLAMQAPLFGGAQSPEFLREYRKQWVKDHNRLVFSSYDPVNNDIAGPVPSALHVVLGIDLASHPDRTAIAAEGYDPLTGLIYHLDEHQWHPLHIDDIAAQVEIYRARYNPVAMTCDEGALGKLVGDSLRARPPYLSVEAAEKARKLEFIQFVNADLAAGKIRIPRTSDLANDLGIVQYDIKKRERGLVEVAKKPHSDIADAWLYAVRKLQTLYHHVDKPKLSPDDQFAAWRLERIEAKNRGPEEEFVVEDTAFYDE